MPVSLGRATRLVPPALRKQVALRDGGCRYPGCPRGAAFCEAHHVRFWRDGGGTDLGNLVLLCRYHHHLVHDRGHDLRLHADGGVTATRRDGRTVSSKPRGPTVVAV
ncbi:MAG TPA: HNH endonuclease signature motif containing protein [Frankiaceae bacterium]|nr:HNH endonuclease signature motif containing protein [Frankiaceae bacterium]